VNIVYQFGILPPFEGADLVEQQLRMAWEYRKKLTELERESRDAQRAIREANGDIHAAQVRLEATNAACEAAWKDICRHRAKTHKKDEPAAMTDALKARRAEAKLARAALAIARKAWRSRPEAQRQVDALAERLSERIRTEVRAVFSRKGQGLRHGTYTLVEDAAEMARNPKTVPIYRGTQPHNPRYPSWDGGGRIGVQIAGGMTVAELTAGHHTFLRMTAAPPPPPRKDDKPRRVGQKDIRAVWLRVGTNDADRSPVWAKFLVVKQREFPDGAVIMRAIVRKRRIGPRSHWTIGFVLRVPDPVAQPRGLAIAIDVGWRKLRDGVRVCAWHGEDGKSGELLLPKTLVFALTHPDEIRSTRDELFNAAKAKLKAFLSSGVVIPEWLKERTVHMHAWHSPAKLASLLRQWQGQRFEGDAAIWHFLADPENREPHSDGVRSWSERADWWGKDQHLWHYESDERQKGLRMRLDVYRNFGAALTERYGTVVFEDFDLRKVAVRRTEKQEHDNASARHQRTLVAVSDFRAAVEHAFRWRGKYSETVNAAQSTHTCHACGHVAKFDAAAQIVHECVACGAVWDQDENSAQVLLGRYLDRKKGGERAGDERSSGAQSGGGARDGENPNADVEKGESRRARSKRKSLERKARIESARKDSDKVTK